MQNEHIGGPQSIGNTVTFTPHALSLTDAEVANPWRGAYDWYHNQAIPDWQFTDSYMRYDWKDIEPIQGDYDFSRIDKELALAQARHGKFGFRIMPANVDNIAVPDYLVSLMPHGQWITNSSSGKQAYEPDWNNPNYLARAQALLNALGQRYNNDPRLGWIDIFPYGDWGEWHTYGFPDNVIAPMSLANQQKLIDANIAAFSHKRLVMFTNSPDALTYALSRSEKIGIRVDCLGTPHMGGAVEKLQQVFLAQERWRTAPFIFEACTSADFQIASNQVKTYHAAMIGDGNFHPYTAYSYLQQQYLKQTFALSGYRFVLDHVTLPSRITMNTPFLVTTAWSNVNVTPAYTPWNIMLRLADSAGNIVWQGKSKLDLQKLVPTTNQITHTNTPIEFTEQFMWPSTLSAGKYTLSIQIVDPDHYYDPLHLAIQGRAIDGSYMLGRVSIK
ncbi:MAG: DUF4832 domain-containing protein [Ktedonobacteraceae bacterium]